MATLDQIQNLRNSSSTTYPLTDTELLSYTFHGCDGVLDIEMYLLVYSILSSRLLLLLLLWNRYIEVDYLSIYSSRGKTWKAENTGNPVCVCHSGDGECLFICLYKHGS